jgi:hypothetical protein
MVLGGCGGSSSSGSTSTKSGLPRGTASVPNSPSRTSGRRSAAGKPRQQPGCQSPADVLAGVYHPFRLHVLASCRSVSGTVAEISHEVDGDVHIRLNTGGALTNSVNESKLDSRLVVEFMPRDGGHLPVPSIGDHISITGAWVLDAEHGWNELHPVWSEVLAGVTYRSGPQYGGSPADSNSSDAAADCTSGGRPCTGYGSHHSAAGGASSASPTRTPSGGAATSSGTVPASHLRSGEFCSNSKEAFYEANGYTCSPGSDGRERLHKQ